MFLRVNKTDCAFMFQKLYVRIWLAVVLAVAVLTFLVGMAWRMAADPPLREVVVRNAQGEIIGTGKSGNLIRGPGHHQNEDEHAEPPHHETHDSDTEPVGQFGRGPEFTVQLQDGQTVHLHLPRPPRTGLIAPFGFFWTLGLVAVAVALATYPIVRRLTRRLETLQSSMQRWGNGELNVRAPITGGDEVGLLAERFNAAAEHIENLVKARDALLASQKSLLANASHELRSPLTRIRMGLELMGEASSESTAQRRLEIERNLNELDQLIAEILLASRLDAQESDLGTIESVDLVGLAAEECARTSAQLETQDASVVVPGISKLLRRAVRNLLENARRYSAGDVSLLLHQDNCFAVIQVNDQGPGVPEALQTRIFEPFYRLPGASEHDGGVGLGLALVQSIALRHGGSVSCHNRTVGGASFVLRLPLTKATR